MSDAPTHSEIATILAIMVSVLFAPGLVAVAFVNWTRKTRHMLSGWRSIVGVAGMALTSSAWFLFAVGVVRGWVGGFGSHYLTHPMVANWCLLISFVGILSVAFLKKPSRLCAELASILVFFLWFGSEMVA
jgi:uncharacterized membrane protein